MLSEIQTACTDHLNGIDFFSADPAITVLSEQKADYENAIDTAVESLGLCLLIMTVTAADAQNQVRAPDGSVALAFKDIAVHARAMGDPAVGHKSGVSVATLAEAAAWYLKGFKPIEGEGPMVLQKIELTEDRSAPLAYDAIFSLQAKTGTPPSRRDHAP